MLRRRHGARRGGGTGRSPLGDERRPAGTDGPGPAPALPTLGAMTTAAPAWIHRYPHDRALRRRAEVGFWAAVLLVQAAFNTVVSWIDLRGTGRAVAAWEPLLWELTSALVVAALIPAVVVFERRFVLRWGTLRRHLPWHVLASVVYCTAHLAGMWALRHAGYAALGERYAPPGWWAQWGY